MTERAFDALHKRRSAIIGKKNAKNRFSYEKRVRSSIQKAATEIFANNNHNNNNNNNNNNSVQKKETGTTRALAALAFTKQLARPSKHKQMKMKQKSSDRQRLQIIQLLLSNFNRFRRSVSDFTGSYRVLLGFTGFYLVLPSLTGFFWVLPSFISFT